MKKSLSIFCVAVLLSSQAQAASGFFIGIDGLQTNAKHEAKNSSALLGPQNDNEQESDDGGFGGNLGVRFDPLFFYASAEIFYDRLNSESSGFPQTVTGIPGPDITMEERYGAKANLGFTILPWLTPFATYGVAKVKYETDVSKWETSPIYGVGILFDIPATNLSIKAAYDIQKFDLPYQNAKSETKVGVAHVGLTYTFGDDD